ncbi:MAG: hypothetical protein IH957_11370 [Chloroflexi bacterium]|nr:hypothetical protein [Chloroflexota bacterium]
MGINDDLTVDQLLNVMEEMHKVACEVLRTHRASGEESIKDEDKQAALGELEAMTAVFFRYR